MPLSNAAIACNKLKQAIAVCFLLVALLPCAHAADTLSTSSKHNHLINSLSIGSNSYRNQTLSPLKYSGPEAEIELAYLTERDLWSHQASLNMLLGVLERVRQPRNDFDAFSLAIDLRWTSRATVWRNAEWKIQAGLSIDEQLHVKAHPNFENAAVAGFNFLSPMGNVLAQYSPHISWLSKFSFFAEFHLAPVSLILHPGYVSIDNYTSDNNVAGTVLNEYSSNIAALPVIGGELGGNYNLNNGNRIALSYAWSYVSTRKAMPLPFENASTALRLTFLFGLK